MVARYHVRLMRIFRALCLVVGLGSHYVPQRWYQASQRAFSESPALVQGVLLLGVGLILRKMASAEAVPFVYFQF